MQVLGRMEFPKDYFSKGLSESPAEGIGREELADVEDLISDKSEVCNHSKILISDKSEVCNLVPIWITHDSHILQVRGL